MLSLSWFPLWNHPAPSSLPLLSNPPTPACWTWHFPTLGHRAFTGPRASPCIDDLQGHPLLHMQLEPWIPPCVFFGWLFSPREILLFSSYCCSSYGNANPFHFLGTFSSSLTGDPVLSPIYSCEHPLLYLSGTGKASQETLRQQCSGVLQAPSYLQSIMGGQDIDIRYDISAWSLYASTSDDTI
jgi:hypothetical protein